MLPPRAVRIFSNEKLWNVDQVQNSRFDRVLVFSPEDESPVLKSKCAALRIQLGIVTSDGEKLSIWFPQVQKIGAKDYVKLPKKVVKPGLDAEYPEGN